MAVAADAQELSADSSKIAAPTESDTRIMKGAIACGMT